MSQHDNNRFELLKSGIDTLRFGFAMATNPVEGEASRVESLSVLAQGMGMVAVGATEAVVASIVRTTSNIVRGDIISRALEEHDNGL